MFEVTDWGMGTKPPNCSRLRPFALTSHMLGPPLGQLLTLAPVGVVTPWEFSKHERWQTSPSVPLTPIQEPMSNCHRLTPDIGEQGERALSGEPGSPGP